MTMDVALASILCVMFPILLVVSINAVGRGGSLAQHHKDAVEAHDPLQDHVEVYDVEDGGVFVDGRDVRSYEKDELHQKFGVVF